ncbi:phage major capsid protein [Vibrio cholerae]
MTIETKLDAAISAFDTQANQIAELQDALAGLQTIHTEKAAPKEDLKAKFYDVLKTGEGLNGGTQLIKDGQVKSFNTQDPQGGGAGIVKEVSAQILKRLRDDYVVANLFGHRSVSSVDYEHRVQTGYSTVAWAGENVNCDGVAQTATPTFDSIKLTHGKITAAPVLTTEALTDTDFNAEAFVRNDVAEELARGIALGVLMGDGANKPKGFYTYFDKAEGIKAVAERKVDHFPVMVKAPLTDEELLETLRGMPYRMPARYVVGGKYIVSREMFERISGLKYAIGRHYMHTSATAGVAGSLFGYDVIIDPMNTRVDLPVVFGHLNKAFEVVQIPTALEMVRNPYAIPHCVRFDIQHRVGTIVRDNQAVIGLVVAAARAK